MTLQTLEKTALTPIWQVTPGLTHSKPRAYDTLPYDDEEVLETNWHRDGMNHLVELIKVSWEGGSRAFSSGNMFVYFDPNQVKTHNFRGPDFFVVTEVDPDPTRKSWVVWDEQYRVPNMVIELSSPSTHEVDFGVKKRQYEQLLQVKDYFIYDPDTQELVGWRLQEGRYVPLTPNESGWLWSEELQLWVGVHWSAYHDHWAYYPRFFTPEGELLLNEGEKWAREVQRANNEAQRADHETQRAESERHEKEQAQLQVEQERLTKERLMAKLRELGIDPTTI